MHGWRDVTTRALLPRMRRHGHTSDQCPIELGLIRQLLQLPKLHFGFNVALLIGVLTRVAFFLRHKL